MPLKVYVGVKLSQDAGTFAIIIFLQPGHTKTTVQMTGVKKTEKMSEIRFDDICRMPNSSLYPVHL